MISGAYTKLALKKSYNNMLTKEIGTVERLKHAKN